MSIRGNIAKLKWSMRLLGRRATLVSVLARIMSRIGYDPTQSDRYWDCQYRWFDERFDVETSDHVVVEEFGIDDDQKCGAHDYEPTSPVAFGTTIDRLSIHFRRYAFVDYGSGKGRVLFMAAHFPFQRIIGVELVPELTEQARRNVHRFTSRTGQSSRFDLITGSAACFEPPPVPAVLYFFNPFAADVMRQVLSRIEQSWRDQPRHLILVYHNPKARQVFDDAGFLQLSWETDNVFPWLIYETLPQAA